MLPSADKTNEDANLYILLLLLLLLLLLFWSIVTVTEDAHV